MKKILLLVREALVREAELGVQILQGELCRNRQSFQLNLFSVQIWSISGVGGLFESF